MSLQYKIGALLLAVFTVFGIFTYCVQQQVILPSFLALETSEAQSGMDRAVQTIRREPALLTQPARDWARLLDNSTVQRISQQAGVRLAVWPLQGSHLGAEQEAIVSELGDSGRRAVRENDKENRIYEILPDIFGKPALLLQVIAPRQMSTEGGIVNRHARYALAIGALVILLVLLVGLRRMVLRPIADLILLAEKVGNYDDLSVRMGANRRDELGELAREFNQMVERLADARKALMEQSHQAGIAELASGVLHNIGNAITPIKVRVANIESALRAAPVAEVEMAVQELRNVRTPADRRADLREFTNLAALEFGTLLTTTIEQVIGIAKQIDHVQKILNDQESVSRATRVLRPVDIAKLAGDSVKLLGTEVLNALHVDIDPSVERVDKVLGSPVALQQVVVNLLKNSAESIRSCSPPPRVGRIAVSAAAESQSGREMIRLSVSDNGGGIAAENLSRIFERGYSTKSRPTSGRGMHWCSITAASLGGQITIDSAGVGKGATVSLWLPQA